MEGLLKIHPVFSIETYPYKHIFVLFHTFSLEVVGWFPDKKESENLAVSEDIPLLLPCSAYRIDSDVKAKLTNMREAVELYNIQRWDTFM